MSLHHLAKEIEKKGRGDDRMLVHMTPKEVQGLQAIARAHGGSLTVNPDTGLVEAGFLKNMLPMIAGGALAATGVGAPLAALMVGGGYGLATGSVEKGLMAGLGAYGGAGLMGGLSSAGAAAAPEAGAASTTGTAATQTANTAVAEKAGTVGNQFAYNGAGEMVPSNYAPSVTGAAEGTTLTPQTAPGSNVSVGNAWKGLGQLGTEAGRSAVYDALPKYTLPAAGAAVAGAMMPEQPQPDNYSGPLSKYKLSENYKPFDVADWRKRNQFASGGIAAMAPGGIAGQEQGMYPQSQMDKTQYAVPSQMPTSAEVIASDYEPKVNPYTGEMQYAAGGVAKKPKAKPTGERNLANMEPLDASLAELNNARYNANMSQFELPKSGIAQLGQLPYTVTAAQGGQLGGYSDGGRMLRGPGDGMSDSIPASIGGKQPARLADGEFVVPADVVSHLGNGSTDAGAKKLYAMMDKIRVARTGKTKQAPAVKSDKYLPA